MTGCTTKSTIVFSSSNLKLLVVSIKNHFDHVNSCMESSPTQLSLEGIIQC